MAESSITAKDIMTEKPVILESSTPILEAVNIFIQRKFTSVPVMTTMGDVAGQLTEAILLRALVLHQLQPTKFKILNDCLDMMEKIVYVSSEATVPTIIQAVYKSPTRRVLVKNDGRTILGIISPKDLLDLLLKGNAEAEAVRNEINKLKAS